MPRSQNKSDEPEAEVPVFAELHWEEDVLVIESVSGRSQIKVHLDKLGAGYVAIIRDKMMVSNTPLNKEDGTRYDYREKAVELEES